VKRVVQREAELVAQRGEHERRLGREVVQVMRVDDVDLTRADHVGEQLAQLVRVAGVDLRVADRVQLEQRRRHDLVLPGGDRLRLAGDDGDRVTACRLQPREVEQMRLDAAGRGRERPVDVRDPECRHAGHRSPASIQRRR
jgi:hypothetical protein